MVVIMFETIKSISDIFYYFDKKYKNNYCLLEYSDYSSYEKQKFNTIVNNENKKYFECFYNLKDFKNSNLSYLYNSNYDINITSECFIIVNHSDKSIFSFDLDNFKSKDFLYHSNSIYNRLIQGYLK